VFYCAVLLSAVVTQCSALQGIGQIVSNCLVCLVAGDAGSDDEMTTERRVSVHDMTSCDCLLEPTIAVVHSDRRSRSVDSGLVTDVELAQRTLISVAASEPSHSAPLNGHVIGSCDSGLPQHIEHDGTVDGTQDRLSDCDCSTVVSSVSTQRRDDVDVTCCHSSAVIATQTNNRQSWLLRLFESKLFDMSIAVQYLFNSKESGVQTYIGEYSGYAQ